MAAKPSPAVLLFFFYRFLFLFTRTEKRPPLYIKDSPQPLAAKKDIDGGKKSRCSDTYRSDPGGESAAYKCTCHRLAVFPQRGVRLEGGQSPNESRQGLRCVAPDGLRRYGLSLFCAGCLLRSQNSAGTGKLDGLYQTSFKWRRHTQTHKSAHAH